MYITISLKTFNAVLDFEVDKRQKIIDFLNKVNEEYNFFNDNFKLFIKSTNNQSTINALETFEENNIITGDVISFL